MGVGDATALVRDPVHMIVASTVGVFLIPMLYVVFQELRERTKRRFGGKA